MSETQTPNQELTHAAELMQQKLGIDGMRQLNEQLEAWQELNDRQQLHSPLREQLATGNTVLPEGTLMHGVRGVSLDTLRGIAEKGVISGELLGVVEDTETHGCADFFKVPTDMTLGDYFIWAKEPQISGNSHTLRAERSYLSRMAVIIDPNAEGMAPLLEKDAYQDPSMTFASLPSSRDGATTAAILGGIPRGAIAGLVFSEGFAAKAELMNEVMLLFPDTPILTQSGETVSAQ